MLSGTILVLLAAAMTVWFGPGAAGSGIAELMCILNGVNVPDVIGFKTLFTKIFGTVLAVSGGLAIGKEGPLAHIGANIGVMVSHMPIMFFRCLNNDVYKRQMMSSGISAGVSAAFGAPIGGTLFSYEMSKPNTFWTFGMLWRVFLASSISTFTLSILTSLYLGSPFSLSDQATLKFGKLENEENNLLDIPAAIVIGSICGVLGSLFIFVNTRLAVCRRRCITTGCRRLIEAMFFGLLTAGVFYMVSFARREDCLVKQRTNIDRTFRFYCPDGFYNPFASLIFNTEGGIIRQLLNVPVVIRANNGEQTLSFISILIFFAMWYLFFCLTYGVHVPSGLFLPGLIIGCSVGLLLMQFMVYFQDIKIDKIGGQTYVIIGAAAMIASYTRMTYSLAVIMLETTQAINNFLPIILGIATSLAVARLFNRGLYDYAIRARQMPVLRNNMPASTACLRVRDIIKHRLPTYELELLESVCTVERLYEACQKPFMSFPVVNFAGKVIGMIPKTFIIVLVEQHQWYEHRQIETEHLYKTISDRCSVSSRRSTHKPDDMVDFPVDLNQSLSDTSSRDEDCRSRRNSITIQSFTGEKDFQAAPQTH